MSYTDERSLEVAELLIDVASEIEPADDSRMKGVALAIASRSRVSSRE